MNEYLKAKQEAIPDQGAIVGYGAIAGPKVGELSQEVNLISEQCNTLLNVRDRLRVIADRLGAYVVPNEVTSNEVESDSHLIGQLRDSRMESDRLYSEVFDIIQALDEAI